MPHPTEPNNAEIERLKKRVEEEEADWQLECDRAIKHEARIASLESEIAKLKAVAEAAQIVVDGVEWGEVCRGIGNLQLALSRLAEKDGGK